MHTCLSKMQILGGGGDEREEEFLALKSYLERKVGTINKPLSKIP